MDKTLDDIIKENNPRRRFQQGGRNTGKGRNFRGRNNQRNQGFERPRRTQRVNRFNNRSNFGMDRPLPPRNRPGNRGGQFRKQGGFNRIRNGQRQYGFQNQGGVMKVCNNYSYHLI